MYFFRTLAQTRKQVRQRATRYSLVVVILLFGLFLEAYMHNFNLVYILLFFVFAMAFSAGSFGLLNIGRLQMAYDRSGRLFAGEEGNLFFRITNPAETVAWSIRLHCDEEMMEIPRIDPDMSLQILLPIRPEKRGRFYCDSCSLQSYFPLSTVRFVLPVDSCPDTVIYPNPSGESLQTFMLRQKASFGEERDFDGLAAYSGSESLSRIHWPSVAKGDPSVKRFEHEGESQKLEFDFYHAGREDEARLSQLCLWVLACEKTGQPFVIRMPAQTLHSNKAGIDAILEILALY